jgi:hypothetical protein
MRSRDIVFLRILLGTVSFATIALAADFDGTWKLDVSKSKLQTEFSSFTMKVEKTATDTYHLVYDTVPKSGNKQHYERTVVFDGKAHTPNGAPAGAVELSEHPTPFLWRTSVTENGKLMGGLDATIAADNKTMTTTIKGVGQDGKPVEELYVFDRQ